MTSSTYIPPELCAEQFDAYAEAAWLANKRCRVWDEAGYSEGKAQAYEHAASFLREFAVMKWTKELPTQPGWYWDRLPSIGVISISQITRDHYGKLFLVDNGPLDLYQGREWAGPIPEPTSP
jgi:hypothetical protein